MAVLLPAKVCTKCKIKKQLIDFYTKGDLWDSKCKVCARRLRVKRYKDIQGKKRRRGSSRRLMVINKVTFVDRFEINSLKRQAICGTVKGILNDHILKVVTGAYLKEKKDAA